ncbi:MAG: ABC transporter ATP-binding protein [Wenzhouxiangella sp.]|jgi:peptide/nickel transport system ATP-binding protein|nr:ABC transporter ATP-binding protein [Wenzhouxiangella sp.]
MSESKVQKKPLQAEDGAPALVRIDGLTVDFQTEDGRVRAVEDLSFNIPKGGTVGLVGESGSGKSVTAMTLMRLIPTPPGKISAGTIDFDGQDLLSLSESAMRRIRGKRIGMIFQEPMTSLNPVYRIGEQVAEVLRQHDGLSRRAARDRTLELLDQVGLPRPKQLIDSYPHQLSGGQKQRVMIAQAMSCEPDLLIADEPTTALDVTIQKQVLDLMGELQARYGMSLLFITHDLGVIAEVASHVVVMYRSHKVEEGETRDLFYRAEHPYTRGLISCRPKLESNPARLLTVADFMTPEGERLEVPEERLVPQSKRPNSELESGPALLEVKNLKTHYPISGGLFGKVVDHVRAVDGVSLTIRRGQTFGLVGESGCGKTTLGRSLLRLTEPTAGQVVFDGEDVTAADEASLRNLRRRMQIIFQDPYSSLNPRMTVADILLEALREVRPKASRSEHRDTAGGLLDRVGLSSSHLGRYPHEFSGGQRQRIGIARALAVDPEFVVCDESVSALDVSVQAQILNLLLDLQQEFGLTYLFISHDLSVVNFISDYVGVMNQGKLVEYGTAEQIYRDPQQDYTRNLLAAIPRGL